MKTPSSGTNALRMLLRGMPKNRSVKSRLWTEPSAQSVPAEWPRPLNVDAPDYTPKQLPLANVVCIDYITAKLTH